MRSLLLAAALLACTPDPHLVTEKNGDKPPPPSRTRAWPPERPGYVNPIVAEEALPGDPSWRTSFDAGAHQIEGYTDHVSAIAGDAVAVSVSTDSRHDFSYTVYRLGDYGGAGARRIASGSGHAVKQSPCTPAPTSGLVRCTWPATVTLDVPRTWVSGLYAIKLKRDDGWTRFIPLTIRDDRRADLLFQASVDTYQAYNSWGGTSLYVDQAGVTAHGMATGVSFDRPYDEDEGLGQVLRYEAYMAQFLEHHGYDVTYTTGPDVALGGAAEVTRAGAFLSVGHDEYWDGRERTALENAVGAGVPLLFFSANTAYWKVRFQDLAGPRNPRTMWCYKGKPAEDPDQGPGRTGMFRDVAVPENALLGVMYTAWVNLPFPFVVTNASSFLYAGTDLADGQVLPHLVGYEADGRSGNGHEPAGLQTAASSPVLEVEGTPQTANATSYRHPSGALVFAGGSIEWSMALGAPGRTDARVARMTANVLHEALGLPVPAALANVSGPPDATPKGRPASQVTTLASGLSGPTGVTVLADGTLAVADPPAQRVYQVDLAGNVTPLAGDGKIGDYSYWDDRPGLTARFNFPTTVLSLPDGSIVVSDGSNSSLRRIGNDPDHTVTTLAGQLSVFGFADGKGKNAMFYVPRGLAYDPVTRTVIVADSRNNRVRSVDPGDGTVVTLGGTSNTWASRDGPLSSARFFMPTAVAVASDGRILVADSGDARIQLIDTDAARTVTTIAGSNLGYADGPGDVAMLLPQSSATWGQSEVLVADPGNLRIRGIEVGSGAGDTLVSTFAGSGRAGTHDGPGLSAELGLPSGIAQAQDGTVYVTDAANGRVLAITP